VLKPAGAVGYGEEYAIAKTVAFPAALCRGVLNGWRVRGTLEIGSDGQQMYLKAVLRGPILVL
jgi:hypothetical protein